MAVAIVDAIVSKIQFNLYTQVPVRPLKSVVALLEGAEKGSLMAKKASDCAEWIDGAKKMLPVIKECRGDNCYENNDDDSELDYSNAVGVTRYANRVAKYIGDI